MHHLELLDFVSFTIHAIPRIGAATLPSGVTSIPQAKPNPTTAIVVRELPDVYSNYCGEQVTSPYGSASSFILTSLPKVFMIPTLDLSSNLGTRR